MTATLTPHRWSVAEYEAMGTYGVLDLDLRTELLDGKVFDTPVPGIRRASLMARLNYTLHINYGTSALAFVRSPLYLDPWSMPEPDLTLVTARDDYYASARPTAADTLLLVEVEDESQSWLRGTKLPLYAAAKVPRVWFVNVARRRLLVFEGPVDGSYTKESELGPGDMVAVPGVSVPVPVKDLIGE